MSIQVPPEIEGRLRAEAAARGVSVDTVILEALDLYGQRRGNNSGVTGRAPFNDRRQEIAWTIKPNLKYLGEWVALEGDEVVAHGTDGKAVYESARAHGIASPFLFHVSEPESTPFVGGWVGVE